MTATLSPVALAKVALRHYADVHGYSAAAAAIKRIGVPCLSALTDAKALLLIDQIAPRNSPDEGAAEYASWQVAP